MINNATLAPAEEVLCQLTIGTVCTVVSLCCTNRFLPRIIRLDGASKRPMVPCHPDLVENDAARLAQITFAQPAPDLLDIHAARLRLAEEQNACDARLVKAFSQDVFVAKHAERAVFQRIEHALAFLLFCIAIDVFGTYALPYKRVSKFL